MSFPRKIGRGFTLIELLVVVALITILSSLAAPAVFSVTQARGVADAAEQISAAVELARSEAVTRRTYVWLGLQTVTNAGATDVVVGIVYSKDGSTGHQAANLQPVARPVTLRQVGLTNSSEVPGSPVELAGFRDGIEMDFGPAAQFTDKRSLTFTPLGEVLTVPSPTATSPFKPFMALGIAGVRGTELDPNNIASVAIDGSTGIPTIYRK
jgi:prepilin-type N-terminal cleavage/methylation domain-containing protein